MPDSITTRMPWTGWLNHDLKWCFVGLECATLADWTGGLLWLAQIEDGYDEYDLEDLFAI